MFDEEGKYAGFDDTEPTSRSGGKAEAVKRINASNGFQTQGVDKFMAMYAFPIMPGMRELVVKLLTSGKQVFLVSGGFRQVIAPVARVERILELHASFHGFLDCGAEPYLMPTPPPYDVLLARDFLSIRILLATYGNIGVATTLDNNNEDIPGYHGVDGPFKIEIADHLTETRQGKRRLNQAEQGKVDEWYQAFFDAGYIRKYQVGEPLYGKHAMNTTVAAKKDAKTGAWTDCRVCADSRAVNSITFSIHSLAMRADGSVACWGDNHNGEAPPAGVEGDFVAVAAGYGHSLALRADGSVACWGANYVDQAPPAGVEGDFVAVAAGNDHSLALRADGSVACWGRDEFEFELTNSAMRRA
ncbi:hypothetical protein PPROV_000753700 [Pycnococcus provasolii]|uniref:Uncharacterized protein n=1 Tax=Pycnococcus provasolii TaxID=41880 RepID=A0A830HSS9_9CHLO|nr:hypothetical protein PPROV_000753700 [Pycnococcus provasolii]